jgi:hypothetical protein
MNEKAVFRLTANLRAMALLEIFSSQILIPAIPVRIE